MGGGQERFCKRYIYPYIVLSAFNMFLFYFVQLFLSSFGFSIVLDYEMNLLLRFEVIISPENSSHMQKACGKKKASDLFLSVTFYFVSVHTHTNLHIFCKKK